MLGIAPSARSESPLPLPLPDQCVQASILLKGKVAPCSGLHVNPVEAAEALKAKDIDLPAAREALKKQEDFYEGELRRAHEQTDAAIDATNKLQALIIDKVTLPPSNPSVLESPIFWGVTLFLVGSIAGAATVLALE